MTLTPKTAPSHLPQELPGGFLEVVLLAFPAMLTHLSEALMGVVDSAMVGRLGPTELAAVGFASTWLWTLFALPFGTASGVQTFVSQADGAGDQRSCGGWAWHGFYATVPAGALFVIAIGWFAVPLLAWLGPSPDLQAAAAEYTHTRVFGELGYVVVMVYTCFFRGLGDMRTPLYVAIFANVANGILDYALIFGKFGVPELGVAGAGIATAIASWSAAGVLFALFRRRSISERYHTRPIAPDTAQIRRLLRTSAPIGGQWFIGMASFAVFTTLVARMGDESMATSQAFVMLLSLSYMQAVGISIAASTLVGRHIGADDPDSAVRAYHSALKLGMGLALLIAILFIAIPVPLLRIFTDDPEIVALGRPLLLLGALFQFIDAATIISEGSLRGAGDTRWTFALEFALGWGLLVPAAYLLGVALEGGLMGAWYGALLHIMALGTMLLWRFHSRAWQRIQI
jgi:MATE family multidrug resistance protein